MPVLETNLRAVDFGLSTFVRDDERLTELVGSAFYVAPEVLKVWYLTPRAVPRLQHNNATYQPCSVLVLETLEAEPPDVDD